jgi:pimeloyl-ACP methyl ester carboxylesterase
MSEYKTHSTEAPQLAYDRRGTGAPLLFVHGLTFDRSTWEPIVERLTDRFTCVAVDLPGHGKSGGGGRRTDEIVFALRRLVDELGLEAPIVIGHSMGGAFASIYVAHHPASGLVLVDQSPYIRPFATMLHQFEPALRSEHFRSVFEPIRQSIGVELLPEPQRTAILARQRIDQDLILDYWSEVLQSSPDEMQARIDREMKAISVPVLAVFGHTIDPDTREHMLGHLPSAEIEEWADLGHMVHLMEPDRFARLLADFATRCFSSSPETRPSSPQHATLSPRDGSGSAAPASRTS